MYSLTGLLYNSITVINHDIVVGLIILTAFLPALLTGRIFRELTAQSNEMKLISSVYSADLAGSALGFILVTGAAIPVLGIQSSIFLLSSLIFAGLLFGTIGNKL
jgi:hypothetical protein